MARGAIFGVERRRLVRSSARPIVGGMNLRDALGHRRWLVVTWVALAATCALRVGALGVFMADPSKGVSAMPADPFYLGHSCLTAYVQAARLSSAPDFRLYDRDGYEGKTIESFA